MRSILLSAALVMVTSHLGAQGPLVPKSKTPPPARTMKNTEVSVTVEGCIRGKIFKPDWRNGRTTNVGQDFVNASDFALEGSRELLGLLKKSHDGHQDEITGIAILPPAQQPEGEVKSKRIGSRTTVSGSTTVVRTREPEVNRTVRLKVISIKHLSDKCSIVG